MATPSITIADPASGTSHARVSGGYTVTGRAAMINTLSITLLKTGQADINAGPFTVQGNGDWSGLVPSIPAGSGYTVQAHSWTCSDAESDVTFT